MSDATPTTSRSGVLSRFRLDGKVALVTGAGRGLGEGCALALGEAGAEVVCMSRTLAEIEAVAARVVAAGGKARAVRCDVSNADDIMTVIPSLGPIDVLVNNAGTNKPMPMADVPLAVLDEMLNLNLRGAFLVAQAVVRAMIAAGKGGSIINVSSQMGHVGAPNRTVYCATKHAIEGLTKAMGVELGSHSIRVNSVGPTFIETPLTRPFFENQDFKADTLGRIALGKLGQIEDVAAAVL
jgi:NAD(P)-dependent dehydrogenase (short-subunit alcohol dehydrogenase family)